MGLHYHDLGLQAAYDWGFSVEDLRPWFLRYKVHGLGYASCRA